MCDLDVIYCVSLQDLYYNLNELKTSMNTDATIRTDLKGKIQTKSEAILGFEY